MHNAARAHSTSTTQTAGTSARFSRDTLFGGIIRFCFAQRQLPVPSRILRKNGLDLHEHRRIAVALISQFRHAQSARCGIAKYTPAFPNK
jgi:hypothetical protein